MEAIYLKKDNSVLDMLIRYPNDMKVLYFAAKDSGTTLINCDDLKRMQLSSENFKTSIKRLQAKGLIDAISTKMGTIINLCNDSVFSNIGGAL